MADACCMHVLVLSDEPICNTVSEDTLITGQDAETANHFHISYQCGCGKESVGILDLLKLYLISRLDVADNAYSTCIFKVCSPVKK